MKLDLISFNVYFNTAELLDTENNDFESKWNIKFIYVDISQQGQMDTDIPDGHGHSSILDPISICHAMPHCLFSLTIFCIRFES